MALVAGSRAELIFDVNGADTSRREVETVADALRRLNAQSLQRLSGEMTAIDGRISSLQSTMGKLVSYSIAGFSLGALVGKINSAIDVLGDLDDMAQKTGSSVETLSRLQKVANAFGVDFGNVDAALTKLSKGMAETDDEGSKVQKALGALGVSARDSAKKLRDPAEVMIDAAKALQRYQDGAAKTALINDLLGKSGADLLPYLNDVADNIDEFSEVSQEAAARAAEMQDNLGRLRVKGDELATTIGLAAAPAVNDLASAVLDVMKSNKDLASGEGANWADDMAVGVARLLDVAVLLPKMVSAVGSSFKAVAADIELAGTVAENANPIQAALKVAKGGSPTKDIQAALTKRNEVVAAANAQWVDLWNKPANEFEQAMLKRLAAREKTETTPAPDSDPKTPLNYKPGTADAAAAKQEADAYATLIAAIRAKTAENRREIDVGHELTDSQKMRIKLDEDLASGKLKLSKAHRVALDAALAEQAASETSRKEQLAQVDVTRFIDASTAARTQASAALDVEYQMYGKSTDAREQAMVAVKAEADMEKKLADMRVAGLPVSDQIRAQLEAEKAARVSVEQATLGQGKALAYAAQLAEENRRAEAQAIADPQARAQAVLAIDAGVWQERIRLAGEGTEAQRRLQAEYGTWYARHSKESFADVDLARATQMLQVMEALDESARQAASGMEESFGRVGSAIGGLTTALTSYSRTQAAIAAQLANATKSANGDPGKIATANANAAKQSAQAQVKSYGDMASAAKGFFKENSAGYKTLEAAEKGFRAFEMAMAVKSMVEKSGLLTAFTGLFVASKGTEATVETAATGLSVANAGTQASAWGVTAVVKAIASLPFPWNLAAGAATLAAVVAAGAAMMGSVGGSSAVNMNSAEERQKVQGTGTVLGDPTAKSESMAKSLEIMEKYAELGLGYQSSMLTALRNIETALGGAAKGILQTAGITGGSAFGTHASKDESTFGASHTKDITDSGVKFSGSFGQLRSGTGLGRQYEDVFTTSDGGMFHSGWERTDTNYKALSAEAMKPFTQIFDNMGDLMEDAGTKLGYDSATLTEALNSVGIDFAVSLRGLTGDDLTDALNAGVGVTMDRVAMKIFPAIEKFQKMGEGLGETLVRVAADVQAVDSVFAGMGKAANMSFEAKEMLVQAAGGMEKFADSASSFMGNFYSDAERAAMTKARLAPVLASVGLTTEGAAAQKMFRDFVVGLDTSTEAGAKTYAMLMDVQQAFKDVTSAAADERADLLAEWDDLTLTDAQKRAKERLAIDPTNLALFDQITLQRELKAATDGGSDSLKGLVDSLTATKTSTLAYLDSLALGSLSTLTPLQKYMEAQRQYNAAVGKALADPADSAAASAAQTAANTFLTASRVINASSAGFVSDKSTVQGDMARLAATAGLQLTDAQRQLSALDKQVASLAQLNGTAVAIEQAILNQGAPASAGAVPAFDVQRYAASSSASTEVLAAEVKALRADNAAFLAELKLLRADARQQTGDQIDAQVEASVESANAVAKALANATRVWGRTERVAPE